MYTFNFFEIILSCSFHLFIHPIIFKIVIIPSTVEIREFQNIDLKEYMVSITQKALM